MKEISFKEFKEKLVRGVEEDLKKKGLEFTFKTKRIEKINSSYNGLTVTPKNSSIGITLNIDRFYNYHKDGQAVKDCIKKAVETIVEGCKNQPAISLSSFTDYKQMKDKLIMEVVSAEANEEMIEKVPHQNIEDMALVYRFVIDSNDDGRATILVTNQLIETMGITPEQLHADAVENAPKLKPLNIKGMTEMIAESMGVEPEELVNMGLPAAPEDEQIFVATVEDKIHGAAVIAYPEFMEKAVEVVGGSFYVLPSSVHEVLIVPDNGNNSLRALQEMVKEVNATEVAPEDKLTDSVYHYDSEKKIFELGEKFTERLLA